MMARFQNIDLFLTAAIVIGAVSVSPKNAISGTNTRIVGR
jgi:hypothetical protein